MRDLENHPARSAEFLSRLHDGELDPAERARFETHRASCSECRQAAERLEEALAFFRSARPKPAAPDLAARIVRELRIASPRRRAFGQVFGIDLRWAGAFAAALLAVIIGSSIVIEREARGRRAIRDSAVPVVFQGPTAAPPAPEPKPAPPGNPQRPAEKKAAVPSEIDARRAPKDALRSNELRKRAELPRGAAPTFAPAPPAPQPPSAPAASHDEAVARKAQPMSAQIEERATSLGRTDAAGGESAPPMAAASAPERTAAVRIRVTAPDGDEPAPEISNALELSLSLADRGEYAVVVQSDGSVASVRRIERNRQSVKPENRESHASEELRKLRFATGGRAREVIVRVEEVMGDR
jgi:hypothetical protein